MARSVSTPSTHHRAVGFGVDDCRRSLPPGGRDGLGMDRLTFRKAQLVSSHVHRYGVALTERAIEHAQSKRIQQPPLQGALERASPIDRIITLTDQEVFRGVTELDRDFAVAEAPQQPAQLNFDDLPDVFLLQRVEDHDLVDTVDELGTEVRAQRVLIAQVRGHRDHRVAEIHDAALAVGQPAVVEQLQHHVEHFGMRLLNFVEQDHGVRAAADGLGQLPGLVVADISGRRADHARHGVLLLVFRHVDANQRMLVVKQELRERARELRLADAGRAEEDEAAERAIRILQAGPGAANGVAHRDDRFVLPDDALVEARFHLEELLDLAFHQAADRNAGPLADHFGDVFFVHFLLQHALGFLQLLKAGFLVLDLGLELRDPAVLQLRRLCVVAGALRLLDFELHLFETLLQLAAFLDRGLLLLPMRAQLGRLFLEVGEVLFELRETLLRRRILFLAECLALDLELHRPPLHLVELHRQRVDLHAQLRRRFVHQVDGLVGQEAIGDVAVRQYRGRHQRRVLELDAVMDLVAFTQAAQDADGVFDARFADVNRLEAAFERRIFLDVLLVFVERGGADGVQLPARQHRLQHVRRVHRPLRSTGADHGVQLVDKQHDLAGGVDHFLQHRLQPVLELAAVLRAGDERAHVERHDLLVLQAFRDVAADNALGKAFDDGGLADAGFTDQDRIVLGAARQDLDDAAHFFVAADHRIELALARELGEIAAVLLQRFVLAFRILIGHALAATY